MTLDNWLDVSQPYLPVLEVFEALVDLNINEKLPALADTLPILTLPFGN